MSPLQVADALRTTGSFHLGDSAPPDDREAWKKFFAGIDECASLARNWTLRIHDPFANSFVSFLRCGALQLLQIQWGVRGGEGVGAVDSWWAWIRFFAGIEQIEGLVSQYEPCASSTHLQS